MEYQENKSSPGSTLIEVLIAVVIGAVVLVTIASTSVTSVNNSDFSARKTEALKYLQEGVENARNRRDSMTWTEFRALPSYYPLTETIGNFTRVTTAALTAPLDPDKVTVTVTVSWTDSKGTRNVSSTTYLSKWE